MIIGKKDFKFVKIGISYLMTLYVWAHLSKTLEEESHGGTTIFLAVGLQLLASLLLKSRLLDAANQNFNDSAASNLITRK